MWSTWYHACCGYGVFVLEGSDGPRRVSPLTRRCWRCNVVQRPNASKGEGLPSIAVVQESVVLSMFPRLTELVLDPNWDDLTAKGKRCVMLFIDDSATRLLVKMEGDGLKFSCVAHGLDEVLAVAEKLLASGQVVWEQDTERKAYPGKKKK